MATKNGLKKYDTMMFAQTEESVDLACSQVLLEALKGEMETDNILHSTGLTLRTALAGCLYCKNVLEIFLKYVL